MSLFSISQQGRIACVQELKDRFYEYHSEYIRGRRCAVAPNALVLNPLVTDTTLDKYFAVYCKGYFVTVEINEHSPSDPHPAKLFIQVYPARNNHFARFEWLGTTQITGYFFDEKAIRRGLFSAIRQRNYYCTNRVANSRIDFTPPEDQEAISI